MNSAIPIRLLLFQAADLRGAALQAAFQSQRGIEIVAAISDDGEAIREATRLRADVALLDANLGRATVLEVCRAIRASEAASVLVLDESRDEDFVLPLVEAGANGYIDRSASLTQLVSVVRRLHADELGLSPDLLRATLRQLVARGCEEARRPSAPMPRLSRRQREIAGCLVDGMSNLAMAEKLAISPHTVRTHVQMLLKKLDAHSRIEAATIALDLQRFESTNAV